MAINGINKKFKVYQNRNFTILLFLLFFFLLLNGKTKKSPILIDNRYDTDIGHSWPKLFHNTQTWNKDLSASNNEKACKASHDQITKKIGCCSALNYIATFTSCMKVVIYWHFHYTVLWFPLLIHWPHRHLTPKDIYKSSVDWTCNRFFFQCRAI